MNEDYSKARVLQELIIHNGFATSASAFAKALGYMGKSQIYRILDGTAGDGTIDEVWKRIRDSYGVTDEEIVHFTKAIMLARALWQAVREQAASEKEDPHALAEQLLCALLSADENEAQAMLSREDWLLLSDIRREQPKKYAQLVVMFYIYMNHVERAFKGKIEEVLPLLLNGLYCYMNGQDPETPKELVSVYSSDHPTGVCNLWQNILRPATMVQSFIDPNFFAMNMNANRFLPVASPSLWMTYEGLRNKTASAIFMYENRFEGLTGGRYECVEVEANVLDYSFVPKCAFVLAMKKPASEEESDLAVVASRDEKGQMRSVKYAYLYDAETQSLQLDAYDNVPKNELLPAELHYIDPDQLRLNEEREWRGWMLGYLKKNEERIFQEIMNLAGMTLEDGCEVVDISVSRLYLTIVISHREGSVEEYRIDLESHPGLRQVSPTMKAFLVRHHDDNKRYLEWVNPHIVVAMEEFTRVNS